MPHTNSDQVRVSLEAVSNYSEFPDSFHISCNIRVPDYDTDRFNAIAVIKLKIEGAPN